MFPRLTSKMKLDFPAILIGLHKLVPGILFLIYASEVQVLDDKTTEHANDQHYCSGNTDTLHEALVGRASVAMLSVGAGVCLLFDTLVFAIRFSCISKTNKGLRGKLEAVNHLFEFFTCAIGAAVLHTIAQSEDGLAVQALYAGAGCPGNYADHLENGLPLLAVAYAMVCLEFLIVRVKGLNLILPVAKIGERLQSYFNGVTGDDGGCDLRKVAGQYEDESSAPILGYRDDPDKMI